MGLKTEFFVYRENKRGVAGGNLISLERKGRGNREACRNVGAELWRDCTILFCLECFLKETK